mgnify:CR=1 FL=1
MRSRVSSPRARKTRDNGRRSRSVALDSTRCLYHDIRMSGRTLFLCVANSARSQMAEGLARRLFGGRIAEEIFLNHMTTGASNEPIVPVAFSRTTTLTEKRPGGNVTPD